MKGRKPANLKIVANNEPRMSESGDIPQLPSYLPPEMSVEWETALRSLDDRGLLSNDILPSVESYVIAIWDQRDAMREVQKNGRTFRDKNGEIKKNPAVSDLKIAREEMLRIAVELGLTPLAKSRKGMGGDLPPNPDRSDAPDDGAPPGVVV